MKKLIEFVVIIISMTAVVVGAIQFGNIGNLESIYNLVEVFSGVGLFIGSFIIATLFTAYLVVIAKTTVMVRFMAIPAWLVFSLSLLVTVDQFMGYSYPAVPPQSKLLAYHIIQEEDGIKTIEAWMFLRKEGRARAYHFPYTLEREKVMNQAKRAGQRGENVELDLRRGMNADRDDTIPESMIIYDFNIDPDIPGKRRDQPMPEALPGEDQLYEISPEGEIELLDPVKKKVVTTGPHDRLGPR